VLQRTAAQLDRQMTGAENALRAIESGIASRTGGTPAPAAPVIAGEPVTYAAVPSPPPPDPGISMRDMWALSTGTLAIVALGLVAAFGYLRRIRRDAQDAVVQLRSELWDEMKKVSVGVDAIAVELERIGEGQRYVTKALAEKKEPVPRAGAS
jgi:hypothetical protein